MKRFLAWILACLILLASIGCNNPDKSSGTVQDASPAVTGTPAPETAAPAPTPEPTPDPGALFAQLDREFAAAFLSGNPVYAMQMVSEEDALSLPEISPGENAWGSCTFEDDRAWAETCAAFAERLDAIDYEGLSASQQVAADTLRQYLVSVAEGASYPYQYDPLDPEDGIHNSLELSLCLFDIRTEKDIDTYFRLLQDLPAFFEQVLAYEQERADNGYLLSTAEFKQLIARLNTSARVDNSHYLIKAFDKKIDALDLEESTAADYKARNITMMTDCFFPAFQALSSGMRLLMPQREVKQVPVCESARSEDLAYFLYRLQVESGLQVDVYQAAEKLENWSQRLLSEIGIASLTPYLEADETVPVFEKETTDESLDYLKQFTEARLAPLPAHTLDVVVPDPLLSEGFAAAYVIPSLDDWTENHLLLPEEKSGKDLLLLAHECYPGHLYQTVYQRGLGSLSLSQQLLTPTCYSEGWSQFAEYYLASNTDLIPPSSALMLHQSDMYSIITAAYTSLLVNYYGYTKETLRSQFGAEYAACYELALSRPYTFFPYAFGYIAFMEAYEEAAKIAGDSFDPAAYAQAYLDLGPGYSASLSERMLDWARSIVQPEVNCVLDQAATDAFLAFDESFYRFYVTQNAIVYLKHVSDDGRCPIDISDVRWTLGHYTEVDWQEWQHALSDFAVQLRAIDRNGLSEQHRFAYDTIENYLTLQIESEPYYGYFLLPNSDSYTLTELLELIAQYPFRTEDDVKRYIQLLEDFPRAAREIADYFDYQLESARYELFSSMVSECRDIDRIHDYIHPLNEDGPFTLLPEQLAMVDGLSQEQIDAYTAQIGALLSDAILPALNDLQRSSDEIAYCYAQKVNRKTSSYQDYYRHPEARSYLEWRIRLVTGMTPDELAVHTIRSADMFCLLLADASYRISSSDGKIMPAKSHERMLDELQSIAAQWLPEVPPFTFTEYPSNLLRIWPVDPTRKIYTKWHDGIDLTRPYELLGMRRENGSYLYVAGEKEATNPAFAAYDLTPGRAYLSAYLDAGNATLTQRVLMPAYYDMAWGSVARMLTARHAVSQDAALMEYYLYLDQFYRALLNHSTLYVSYYSPCDYVVGDGYPADFKRFSNIYPFLQFGKPDLNWRLPMAMTYGMYTHTSVYTELFLAVQAKLGSDFDEKAFNAYYLSLGPSYPLLIREAVAEHYDLDLD